MFFFCSGAILTVLNHNIIANVLQSVHWKSFENWSIFDEVAYFYKDNLRIS